MDECYRLLDQILSDTNLVADATGIARCAIIARMYETIKALGNEIQKIGNEKNELELKIRKFSEDNVTERK